MEKHIAIASQAVLAAGLLAASAGALRAAEEEQLKTISGKIQSVQGDRLVLEQGGMFQGEKQLDFRADRNTDILRKDSQLQLSSLQPGKEVEIHYKEENGQQIASAIIVDQDDLGGAAQSNRASSGMSTSGASSSQPGQSSQPGSMSQGADAGGTSSPRSY